VRWGKTRRGRAKLGEYHNARRNAASARRDGRRKGGSRARASCRCWRSIIDASSDQTILFYVHI